MSVIIKDIQKRLDRGESIESISKITGVPQIQIKNIFKQHIENSKTKRGKKI